MERERLYKNLFLLFGFVKVEKLYFINVMFLLVLFLIERLGDEMVNLIFIRLL